MPQIFSKRKKVLVKMNDNNVTLKGKDNNVTLKGKDS